MQPACAGRSEIGRSEVCSEDVSNTAKASVPQSMNDQVGGRQEVGVWSETGGRRVECFEDIEELAVECSSWRTLSGGAAASEPLTQKPSVQNSDQLIWH